MQIPGTAPSATTRSTVARIRLHLVIIAGFDFLVMGAPSTHPLALAGHLSGLAMAWAKELPVTRSSPVKVWSPPALRPRNNGVRLWHLDALILLPQPLDTIEIKGRGK